MCGVMSLIFLVAGIYYGFIGDAPTALDYLFKATVCYIGIFAVEYFRNHITKIIEGP